MTSLSFEPEDGVKHASGVRARYMAGKVYFEENYGHNPINPNPINPNPINPNPKPNWRSILKRIMDIRRVRLTLYNRCTCMGS